METLKLLWSIEYTLFEIFSYKMSLMECLGTTLGLISVGLAAKANIHTWTIGIFNIIAFFLIYYQIQLYSDMFLQVFFLIMSVVGIWQWIKKRPTKQDKKINTINKKRLPLLLVSATILTLLLGYLMSNIHIYLYEYFNQPASFPYADAFTTILSIYATFLMAYKKIECWVLWILVDIVSIILYAQKGMLFISAEYFIFLIMAFGGFFQWLKSIRYAERISFG